MRAELRAVLNRLESVASEIDREVSSRANSFRYSGSNAASDHQSARQIITEYFWTLFCPQLDIRQNWDRHSGTVWGHASALLRKPYGSDYNALDIACSSVEGGLRSVLRQLTSTYLQDQYGNRIGGIVSDYYHSTPGSVVASDSEDFVVEYSHLLPPEKLGGGAAYIRLNYLKVLQELPFLLQSAQVR